jgi:glutamyl-tRNA synthetase
VADFAGRAVPYLAAAGLIAEEPTAAERQILAEAAPLVQERVQLLGELPGMLGFLFTDTEDLVVEDDARATLPPNTGEILAAAILALELIPESDWEHEAIESALRDALIEGLELKPRVAFGPLRVAISGRRVSPPLFESMQILGKQSTLARIDRLSASLIG